MLTNKIKFLIKASKFCNVPFFIYFNKNEFIKNELIIINKIKILFKKKIIIRSAFHNEDNTKSNAGMFESIPNINPKKIDQVKESIEIIFKKSNNSKKDYLIIQDFINVSDLSGVIFTNDPKTSAPITTINFKRSKKKERVRGVGWGTDIITSGTENGELIRFYQDYKINKKEKITNLINITIKKIKKFFGDNLDIEFACKKKKFIFFK